MALISTLTSTPKGVHYERIKTLIPDAIKDAPPQRLKSLKDSLTIPYTFQTLPATDHRQLKASIRAHWQLQQTLDTTLNALQQDIEAFARPVLVQALKDRFAVDLDVDAAVLTLYAPETLIFGIDRNASRVRHTTLLAAALHNFEEAETRENAFRSGSGIFTTDLNGTPRRHAITVEQFTALCRSLDLGAQYQTHLKALLTPADSAQSKALQSLSVAVEKSGLQVAALIARATADISQHGQSVIKSLLNGEKDVRLHGQPVAAHRLRLFGLKLSGIVLFSAVAQKTLIQRLLATFLPKELQFLHEWSRRIPGMNDNLYEKYKLVSDVFANGPSAVTEEQSRRNDFYDQSRLVGPLIVYMPDDPQHPLKEYASLTAFMKVLISQLRETPYQQFFSRFVAQKDRPLFFRRVNERLREITWQQREPLSMGPWWRETAVENPNAEPVTVPISGNVWEQLYRQKRDKAISDARLIAVPTGDEDAKARWKRLVSYLDIGWNIFNFAVMLVPGMGEVMLGVMVAQLMADALEGIEDWSKGDRDEASAHFNSVILNFAQLALMSVGHVLPKGAVPVKPSPFVDGLQPVTMADGATKLWNPDLAPYEHNVSLSTGSKPDALGLHQHGGKQVLRVEDKHYVVEQNAQNGRHQIQHPTRAGAYAPTVEHNGAGAWKTELDRPMGWDKTRLMRRLNPQSAALSDTCIEQVMTVSGVDENALRRLHVEHEMPPPMLLDTLKRFEIHARIGQLEQQILDGAVDEGLAGYLPSLMTELPRWPESRAIELADPLPGGRQSVKYGFAEATPEHTLTVTPNQLQSGKLESLLLDALDDEEIEELLGKSMSSDKNIRHAALRDALAKQARKSRKKLFESQYTGVPRHADARVGRLQSDFPDLPTGVIEDLLKNADPEDLRFLKEKDRLPLRLREQVKAARRQVRVSRAYEGLYLEQMENADTRRLALSSCSELPGWSSSVRIEIRELGFNGDLNASIGAQDAPIRKVLVLDEDGRYNARDAQGLHLHGADDFYNSLLRALPDAQRQALGYDIFEGERLRRAILHKPMARESFAPVLLDYPLRKPAYDPYAMKLRGGMQGYIQASTHSSELKLRVQWLYPTIDDAQIETLLDGFGAANAATRVQELEQEFEHLDRSLRNWLNQPTRALSFSPEGAAELASRNKVYEAIRQCWRRTGPEGIDVPGITRPQALVLDNLPMAELLPGMPPLVANFDHVTMLSLGNCGLRLDQQYFLTAFSNLRRLSLFGNRLSAFPPLISDMKYLAELLLYDNQIVLDDAAVARLRTMKHLRGLKMDRNPLGQVPDVSQMPDLLILTLNDAGIDRWPVGTFATSRPRNFYLDLRNNRIRQLPTVAPGTASAEVIARTNISRTPPWLSSANLEQLQQYIESVGLDPERSYPPQGMADNVVWAEGLDQAEWNARQSIWNAVEDEFNSEGFFNEIRKLTESADFRSNVPAYRVDLTAKVWRMLSAMEENSALREEIFAEALVPTSCGDAGAQFFNAMGVKVLLHEVRSLARLDLVEAELAALARGKSRLDELGNIARRRVAERLAAGETFRRVVDGRVVGTIDEVEVHLAYMTDLAERLDLPWQSRGMLFRKLAGVTEQMIEEAYQRVIALEEGELLAPLLLEQPFWRTFVEKTYSDELGVLLEGLAGADDVTQFEAYRKRLQELTQQAIDRAKLQRVDLPFEVETNATT